MTGKAAKSTRVNNQPRTKAIINPDIPIAITYNTKGILSPIAPWNAIVSVENCEES